MSAAGHSHAPAAGQFRPLSMETGGETDGEGAAPDRLRAFLQDCLSVWAVSGSVEADTDGVTVRADAGRFVVRPPGGPAGPSEWTLRNRTTGEPERGFPSIVGLLRSLRLDLAPAAPRSRLVIAPQPIVVPD